MATALTSAAAAAVVVAIAVLLLRAWRARGERRLRAFVEHLDGQLAGVARMLDRVVSRAQEARGVEALELTVELEEVLRRVAADAAGLAGADAAQVHVRGVGGEEAVASFGSEDGVLPEPPVREESRPSHAVTLNWAYTASAENDLVYTSVLVVPIVEDATQTGSIAVYAREGTEFDAEVVRSVEALAARAAPAISSARRFAETERSLTDEATGVRNRKGYELELERAVERARSDGVPLSILVLSAGRSRDLDRDDETALEELAALLLRQTRAADAVCRTSPGALGVVLPETTSEASRRLYLRLQEEAGRTRLGRQTTFAVGLVEWRPNETSEALGARALASVGRSRLQELTVGGGGEEGPTAPATGDALGGRLAQAAGRTRGLGKPLSVLVLDVDVDEPEERTDEQAKAELRNDLEAKVRQTVSNGATTFRVAEDALAVVLPGSSPREAEELLVSVRAALERDQPEIGHPVLSAGITEILADEDATRALERAVAALGRARQAGRGSVVVAVGEGDGAAR